MPKRVCSDLLTLAAIAVVLAVLPRVGLGQNALASSQQLHSVPAAQMEALLAAVPIAGSTQIALPRATTRHTVPPPEVAERLADKLTETLRSIAPGESANFTIPGPEAESLFDRSAYTVSVEYDQRPIGGILSVKLEFCPVFSGVGVSNHAETTRAVAVAVDEITEDVVRTLVDELRSSVVQSAR